jgi:hypothetical protein
MAAASLTARMRHSRFASPTTAVWLVIVLALAGYDVFHHASSSGGTPRADSAASFALTEAESVVLSLRHVTATPTPATVYAALNASSQLHGHLFFAAGTGALDRANTLYVASSLTRKHYLMLWDRSPSGDVWSVSIVANPPGLKGRLVLNGPSSPGILRGAMTSKPD